ncbi:hypothetical protein AB0L66_44565, partial [Streptomyces sp. NPDC052207]
EEPARRRRLPDPVRTSAVRAVLIISVTLIEAARAVLDGCRAREEKEAVSRKRYANGELSLDVNSMRERLAHKGLTYVDRETADDH